MGKGVDNNISNSSNVQNSPVNTSINTKEFTSSNGKIKERDNCYWKYSTAKGEVPISNFIVNAIEEIEKGDITETKIEIVTSDGDKYYKTISNAEFSSSTYFKRIIINESIGLIFKGKNEDLDDIREIFSKKVYYKKKGIECIGIRRHNDKFVFVSPDGVIDSEFEDVDDLVYVGDRKDSIDTLIYNAGYISEADLSYISKALFNFNKLSITATVLGFAGSCFLKEKLYLINETKFNHLIMVGEAGAGKSQTKENILMPIFSTNLSTCADQCSRFVAAKFTSSNNTVPFFIDEYKPTRMIGESKKTISALLRNTYDRIVIQKGTKEQKTNRYETVSPIVLIGEMSFDESAVIERTLLLYFSKSATKDPNMVKSLKILKRNKKVLNDFGKELLKNALKIEQTVLCERQKNLLEKYHFVDSRVQNTVINCMLGISLIKDLYERLELDFEKMIGYSVEELNEAIISGVRENILEGKQEVKGSIEKCIEVLNDMAELGEIEKGIHYTITNSSELAIHITGVYAMLIKYMSKRKMTDIDMLSEKQFKEQLKMKDYCINSSKTVSFANRKKNKAAVLDISILSERVDISNLCQ